MNKDYLSMMDEGELEAYAKVLGFTTAAAQTAAVMGFQCFLIKGLTPAGVGWAEAVSRSMRNS